MSPIRSSAAAGSSHALGDNRFVKVVTEVTAQRKESRFTALSTTSAVTSTFTLAATPSVGNHLVVCLTTNAALSSPTCTYGSNTTTQITGTWTTGICGYLFYIPVDSNAAGTNLSVVSTGNTSYPSIVGVSVTELSGLYAASPIDKTGTNTGAWSSTSYPTITFDHTTVGAYGLAFTMLAGAQTTVGFTGSGTASSNDWASNGSWGNHTAVCDVYAISEKNALKYTATLTLTELLGLTTARNGVALGASFRPAA